jgi:hypothetical protein
MISAHSSRVECSNVVKLARTAASLMAALYRPVRVDLSH